MCGYRVRCWWKASVWVVVREDVLVLFAGRCEELFDTTADLGKV